jgi:hypothetical protein
MKKTIHAYYESIPSIRQEEEFACSNLWKGSWESNGWNCVMLNKTHAAVSPLFRSLMGRFLKYDGIAPSAMARFSRWCALHAAGGGWMSDYDVLNLGFTPSLATEIESVQQLHMVAGKRSYIFYATQAKAEEVIGSFIAKEILSNGAPIPESDIFNSGMSFPELTYLFHPDRDGELTRSQQMAEKISN